MKKVYAIILSAALAMTMCLPVLAAPSPSAEVKAAAEAIVVDASVDVDVVVPTTELANEVVRVTSNPEVLAALGIPTGADLLSTIEVKGTVPAGGTLSIPFKVTNASVGDVVYVLHRMPSGQWEVVGSAVMDANMMVTGVFSSLSPVAFMVVKASDAAAASVTSATTAAAVAPKTGENSMIIMVEILAAISLAGTVLLARKARA